MKKFMKKQTHNHVPRSRRTCTWVPPMQKSTIKTQMTQEDMKKYSSTRKVEAATIKMIAPVALISITSASESPLPLPAADVS